MLPPIALETCIRIHEGQRRKDNATAYAIHPIRVATRLEVIHAPERLVIAALLHDTVEDQPDRITFVDITAQFGITVAHIVKELTKRDDMTRKQYIESFSDASVEACIVKMFDRLDNLQDWAGMDPKYKPKYAQEALDLLNAIENNPKVYAMDSTDSLSWIMLGIRRELRLEAESVLLGAVPA